jgi:preprotein translocase subunit YajC
MDPKTANGFIQFVPLILIFGIFYVLLILPMRRRQKKHQELLGKLAKGDRVITSGGIFGTVLDVEGDVLTLRIAENVKIQVARSAVAGLAKDAGTVDLNPTEPK